MENQNLNLPEEQVSKSALKIKELLGCFVYSLFYTFCLYKNNRGITFPFLVGVTLYFSNFILRRYGATPGKNTRFLEIIMIIASLVVCSTDSTPVIIMTKLLLFVLFAVYIVELMIGSKRKSISVHIRTIIYSYCGAIANMFKPFSCIEYYYDLRKKNKVSDEQTVKKEKRNKIVGSVLLGVGISIPVIIIIIALLCSADAVFSEITGNFFEFLIEWNIFRLIFKTPDFWLIIGMITLVFLLSGGFMIYQTHKEGIINATNETEKNWDSYVAITFSAIICLIYVVFSIVQIFGLFLGQMEIPAGYTYAKYARQGFFQLLFVCIFNVLLVLCCCAWFKRKRALQIILTVISICTYIMTASSAYRMLLYIKVYNLTFLRVLVLWGLLMIAIVMAGVMYSIYINESDLFRYIMVAVSVGFVCFAIVHPDYWIAKYNINQAMNNHKVDFEYLVHDLSLDAVPAIAGVVYDENEVVPKECEVAGEEYLRNLEKIVEEIKTKDVRKVNISRIIAQIYIKKVG